MIEKNILFGIPLLRSKIDPKLYNKKEIIKTIEKNYSIDPNRNKWYTSPNKSKLHHSFNDWNNKKFKNPNFKKIIPVYAKTIMDCLKTLSIKKKFDAKIAIRNYTCLKSSQYMEKHHHISNDVDFTAVHYVKFNKEKHLPTTFHNSQNFSNYFSLLNPKYINFLDHTYTDNSFMSDEYYLNTKEDDFFIIPSILEHSIPIQNSDETRITIVLNISIELTKDK